MASELRINDRRLLADLADLARIGATEEGGVNRPALTPADLEARDWFRERAEAAGLEVRVDGAGNISAILRSEAANARTILFGSHMDTVPDGGRFDGALGVVVALEAVRRIKENGNALPHHLEVISFTDEEGTTGQLFLGSRALTGLLTAEDLAAPRLGRDHLLARLQMGGITEQGLLTASRGGDSIKAFVEVHIEQGPRLEEAGIPIGVVNAVVGIYSFWLTFVGRADHAGPTPMDRRLDALRGVAEFIRQSRELVVNRFPNGVMNCGIVEVSPGAFNIVPERARLALEFRHSEPSKLEAMREALLNLALHVVEIEGLGLEVDHAGLIEPVPMSRDIIKAIEQACENLSLAFTAMPSYAGHDSLSMASIVETGMFFVPCVGGASHSPREMVTDQDCINAGNVMLHTILGLVHT